MKRILTVFFAMILVCLFSIPAYTQTKFETAEDLYYSWAGGSFPDYVCGVWWTDGGKGGNLTIAVQYTDEGLKGIEKIKELVNDDSTLTFTFKKYSYNYLCYVQEELAKLYKTSEEHGLIGTSIADKKNMIVLGIMKGYENNETTEKMIKEITKEYGSLFIVNYTYPPVDDDLHLFGGMTPSGDFGNDNNNESHVFYATVIVSLLLTLIFVFIYRNHTHVLQTTVGMLIPTSPPLSQKNVKRAVKNSSVIYPEDLDKKIMEAINKNH